MDSYITHIHCEKDGGFLKFEILEDGQLFIEDSHGSKYITSIDQIRTLEFKIDQALSFMRGG